MSSPLSRNCQHCNRLLRPSARFCDHCGLPLVEDDEVTAKFESLPANRNPDPLIGLVIDSKYKIVKKIADGGMGKVYEALRVHIGDLVVIKVLPGNNLTDAIAAERFRREARAAARIHHRNVVVIHDFGEVGSRDIWAYIVMELVSGISLKDLLDKEKHLSVERTIALMSEICSGVGAGHTNGVIHRDLKPSNLIVVVNEDSRESVKVVDFGLAKMRDELTDPTLTQPEVRIGTLRYMSPEQCRAEELTNGSDVYSLGILTYEMLAGTAPFTGASACNQHLKEIPPPFAKKLAIPEKVEAVIMKALAKDTKDRPQNAMEYLIELKSAFAESQNHAFAGNLNSTVEDKPKSFSDRGGLNYYELKMLNWSFELAFHRNRNDLIQVDHVLDEAGRDGLDREVALTVLEKLMSYGLIQANKHPNIQHFLLTGAAFDEYGKAFLEGYEAIKKDVIRLIANGTVDNFAIANALKQSRSIIDRIINLLREKNLLTVSRRLGGKIVIKTVNPDLANLA